MESDSDASNDFEITRPAGDEEQEENANDSESGQDSQSVKVEMVDIPNSNSAPQSSQNAATEAISISLAESSNVPAPSQLSSLDGSASNPSDSQQTAESSLKDSANSNELKDEEVVIGEPFTPTGPVVVSVIVRDNSPPHESKNDLKKDDKPMSPPFTTAAPASKPVSPSKKATSPLKTGKPGSPTKPGFSLKPGSGKLSSIPNDKLAGIIQLDKKDLEFTQASLGKLITSLNLFIHSYQLQYSPTCST